MFFLVPILDSPPQQIPTRLKNVLILTIIFSLLSMVLCTKEDPDQLHSKKKSQKLNKRQSNRQEYIQDQQRQQQLRLTNVVENINVQNEQQRVTGTLRKIKSIE
jgi:hypothetical protein